jgi:hypothetical protein
MSLLQRVLAITYSHTQGALSKQTNNLFFIFYFLFFNCNWVFARWQWPVHCTQIEHMELLLYKSHFNSICPLYIYIIPRIWLQMITETR